MITNRRQMKFGWGRASWLCLIAVGCGSGSGLPVAAGMGSNPSLPTPSKKVLPTVNIAPARGWRAGEAPLPGAGLQVQAFARGLEHPRWLYVLPNGDVLVAETNAPPKPDDAKGVRGWFLKRTMKKAGGATPSANRITLLRDADHNGVAERRVTFLEDLNSPFGMALVGNDLYVAETDALIRFSYRADSTRIADGRTKIADLPAGRINHHWTKNVVASRDGNRLYVSVGSNSNVGENGIDKETDRAAIWEIDPKTGAHRVFASGLRNPVGMAINPVTGALWAAVNERDELGNDLVPDYMTSVRDGGFYGWPYSYFGQHVDTRVKAQRPDLVARAIKPDYALGAHTASLGLAFTSDTALSAELQHGAFVGQHGSWNRVPLSGYKVIFVPFSATGSPTREDPVDVLTGFVDENSEARGRPVGVAVDNQGALLVADDVGNTVWRVVSSATKLTER